MQTITLPDAIDGILNALQSTAQAGRQAGKLPGLRSIVLGDRARPRPDLPSLWIFTGPALNDHTTHGLAETWRMPVHLVVLVNEDLPEDGYRLAADLAARARKLILEDRRLGLDYVADVVSTRFEPSREQQLDHLTIYASAATVTVRFSVFERS